MLGLAARIATMRSRRSRDEIRLHISALLRARFILRDINFSHADLRGANLVEAASLEGIFWGDCTCPDGIPSHQVHYTCVNNLAPARVADVLTDPDPDPESEFYVRNNQMVTDIERSRASTAYEPPM